tara:strand:- start:317 stop:508 length:192 start_codon:yes stop_codon:yes gene_type:complete
LGAQVTSLLVELLTQLLARFGERESDKKFGGRALQFTRVLGVAIDVLLGPQHVRVRRSGLIIL